MKRLACPVVIVIIAAALLAACNSTPAGDPQVPVRAFYEEFAKAEPNFDSLLCSDANVRDGVDKGSIFTHLMLLVMAESGPATIGYQDLQLTTTSTTTNSAIVHVSGTFAVSLPTRSVTLPPDVSKIDTDITVAYENGAWKVCSNPF
jgi:hypothetical protein